MLAREDPQIDRNKRQSLPPDLQDQHPGIHIIVNRLFRVLRRDVDFGCSSAKLSAPGLLIFRAGLGSSRSRSRTSIRSTKSAPANEQKPYRIPRPEVHLAGHVGRMPKTSLSPVPRMPVLEGPTAVMALGGFTESRRSRAANCW